MSISFSARITFGIMKLINFKKVVEKRARKAQKRSRRFTPKSILKRYRTVERIILGHKVTTFEKENSLPLRHLIYLHGGAYIFGASGGHWSMLEKMINRKDLRVSVLDYPLAPEKTYREAYEMISKTFVNLTEAYPKDNFVLIGDSAGGALAMGFCQKLISEENAERISECILICPWLDLTMKNPDVQNYTDKDIILSLGLLEYGGEKFAGGDDKEQYLLSPINGVLRGFPKTLVLFASEEVFKPDCLLLASKAKHENALFVFSEFPGMQHAWPVFPIPEQEVAVDEMISFLLE